MNALEVAAMGAEVAVVSTLAVSSYHIAFGGPNPDWLAGAPIVTVVALETMRLPLALRLPRVKLLGTVTGVAMLGCLGLR
jgi:hypothetical protein